MKIPMAAHCFDVQGIASLVKNLMGVGVLPAHVFLKVKESGIKLHQFKSKKGTINIPLSLAYLDQRWNVPLNQFVTVLKELLSNIAIWNKD